MRGICYVTGSRADFGLFESTLQAISAEPGLSISIAVTGMHLDRDHGLTVRDVERSGLPICARIESPELDGSGAGMAMALATMIRGFTSTWQAERPHVVVVLGDRGEMLAGALAAAHLDIPVAHVHGGERSGTIDESLRHAISKLAHLHFVSTEASRIRLERMGERPDRIWVTGAPGLDGLSELGDRSRDDLCAEAGLNPSRPIALFCHHPVLQGALRSAEEAEAALDVLGARGVQVLALAPNSDAGSLAIRRVLEGRALRGEVAVVQHLNRRDFASWMARADLIVGNSSAGIIEAATFGTPVVNIGDRQKHRERNSNVFDVSGDVLSIVAGVERALSSGRVPSGNRFGDGRAAARIVEVLRTVDLYDDLTSKCNVY